MVATKHQSKAARELTQAQFVYRTALAVYETAKVQADQRETEITAGVDLDDEAMVSIIVDRMMEIEDECHLPAWREGLKQAEAAMLQAARAYMETKPEYRAMRRELEPLWTTSNYVVYHKLIDLTARLVA